MLIRFLRPRTVAVIERIEAKRADADAKFCEQTKDYQAAVEEARELVGSCGKLSNSASGGLGHQEEGA